MKVIKKSNKQIVEVIKSGGITKVSRKKREKKITTREIDEVSELMATIWIDTMDVDGRQ